MLPPGIIVAVYYKCRSNEVMTCNAIYLMMIGSSKQRFAGCVFDINEEYCIEMKRNKIKLKARLKYFERNIL